MKSNQKTNKINFYIQKYKIRIYIDLRDMFVNLLDAVKLHFIHEGVLLYEKVLYEIGEAELGLAVGVTIALVQKEEKDTLYLVRLLRYPLS